MLPLSTVKSRIREIIRDTAQIQAPEIDETAHLHKDLKIDSLTLLEIALTIDQEFKTNFSESELMRMSSVQVTADMIMERLAAQEAAAAA